MDKNNERNHMQESRKGIHHKLLPALSAGTDRRVPNSIRIGDVIGVQSNAMEKEENRMVKQKGEK